MNRPKLPQPTPEKLADAINKYVIPSILRQGKKKEQAGA